jgi:hypothetical protein
MTRFTVAHLYFAVCEEDIKILRAQNKLAYSKKEEETTSYKYGGLKVTYS